MAADIPRRFDRLMLDFRAARVGGAVVNGRLFAVDGRAQILHAGALRADTIERSVVVLVHGFNVDRDNGVRSLGGLMQLLAPALQGTLLIGVLWPGDSRARALSYSFEGNDADDTARRLAQWLATLICPTASLSFVAHSKGCRVVMRTIEHLAAAGQSRRIDQVCLLAAAIDRTSLTAPGPKAFAAVTLQATRVTVLSSVSDRVLRFAYPAGDLLQGWVYAETDEPGLALGFKGPRHRREADPAARARVHGEPIPEAAGVDHGDYLPGKPPASAKEERVAAFVAAALTGQPAPHFA